MNNILAKSITKNKNLLLYFECTESLKSTIRIHSNALYCTLSYITL